MAVFADTSGFFAVVATEDTNHRRAQTTWEGLIASGERLISHSYVLSETFGLVQRRFGMDAIHTLQDEILPAVEIVWVDKELHEVAARALTASQNRRISLVDYVSFEVMARRGIQVAFAFDEDFVRAGFRLLS